jgi:hypothetical protein
MGVHYLKLALLTVAATTALSQSARQLGDFDWGFQPEDGFPAIAFNDTTQKSGVAFKYSYTGTLTAAKVLEVKLYQNDCVSPSDESLAFIEAISGDELDVDIDIIQETISNSVHYKDINGTAAIIGFCLRVDYNYIDNDGHTESINFYETSVTINVDLTANFDLTQLIVDRSSADTAAINAQLDYPVEAYICVDDDSEVENPAPLTQGSGLQVCIKIDDSFRTHNIIVEDILTFVISQPNGTATDSVPINNAVTNPLTDKVCRESGICNVKSQLQSKFFADANPGNLRVDGVAILAFRKEGNSHVRRLRAPIRGLITGDDIEAFMAAQQRQLNSKEDDHSKTACVSLVADSSLRKLQDGVAQAAFVLEVSLQGINRGSGGQDISKIVVDAIVLAVVFGFGFLFCARRNRKESMKHHVSTASRGAYSVLPLLTSTSTAVQGISKSTPKRSCFV